MFAFLHFYTSVVSAIRIISAQLVLQGVTMINWIGGVPGVGKSSTLRLAHTFTNFKSVAGIATVISASPIAFDPLFAGPITFYPVSLLALVEQQQQAGFRGS